MTQIYDKLFHNQTIIKWVKKAAISLPERKNHDPMDVVEMDKLFAFVKKTLKTRVWTAVDRNKKSISAFEVGSGKASALRKLIDKIEKNNLKIVCHKTCSEQIRNLLSRKL